MQAELRSTGQSTSPPRKPHSLRKNRDFQRVRKVGRTAGGALLSLGWAANALPATRCGYTVGKRVGGAVVRNRVKRRLREIMRLALKAEQLAPGYDLVWIARPGAAQATYQQLAAEVSSLLRRARLWKAGGAAPEVGRTAGFQPAEAGAGSAGGSPAGAGSAAPEGPQL
jgi:ribonuclease P protein component